MRILYHIWGGIVFSIVLIVLFGCFLFLTNLPTYTYLPEVQYNASTDTYNIKTTLLLCYSKHKGELPIVKFSQTNVPRHMFWKVLEEQEKQCQKVQKEMEQSRGK